MMKKTCLLIIALMLAGCESLSYYSQAFSGQMRLLSQKQPIDELLVSGDISTDLKRQLELVQEVRTFAKTSLVLPVDDAYSDYVDTGREFVIWNVYAAEALDLEPFQWCFPVAGCVSYRGYFKEQDALAKASELKARGFDVHVGGVAAYSTLGWFDDPVLNTFVHREPLELAGLLIHELAHRQLYISGDTAFNESFATAVEHIGLQQWQQARELSNHEDISLEILQEKRKQKLAVIGMVLEYREKLSGLYQSAETDEVKLQQKQLLMEKLHADYLIQKKRFHWTGQYDSWIATMNNAKMAILNDYQAFVPAFKQLWQQSGEDWAAFYSKVEELGDKEKPDRDAYLASLAQLALNKP